MLDAGKCRIYFGGQELNGEPATRFPKQELALGGPLRDLLCCVFLRTDLRCLRHLPVRNHENGEDQFCRSDRRTIFFA